MLSDFDGYLAARRDYAAYLSAKGYRIEDSGYCHYQGIDESEDEIEPRSLGAMSSQEYDNYYYDTEDEF
jgi:hypothetical protein